MALRAISAVAERLVIISITISIIITAGAALASSFNTIMLLSPLPFMLLFNSRRKGKTVIIE